jgi:hypothetical protein
MRKKTETTIPAGSIAGITKAAKLPAGGPSIGAKIHIIFEVSPENTRHQHSWLRLPTTCLFEDAPRAMTLAIRIEWKNGDEVHDAVGRCCGQRLYRDAGIHLVENERQRALRLSGVVLSRS